MKLAALLLTTALAAPLSAQDTANPEDARKQLEEAIKRADDARAEAVKALDALNAARTRADRGQPVAVDAPTEQTEDEKKREKAARKVANCEAIKPETDYNGFTQDCLGMKSRHDFETANVALRFGGTSTNEVIELTGEYDFRFRKDGGLLGDGASYAKVILGAFTAERKGGENAFFDFSEIQSGSGFRLGFEYGVFNRPKKKRAEIIDKGIQKAKRDCVLAHTFNTEIRKDPPIFQPNTAVAECSGNNLFVWIAKDNKRQNLYWKETIGKLYHAGEDQPNFLVGLSYRQAYQDFRWLADETLGAINSQSTLDGLEEQRAELSTGPFSIKAYLGGSISTIDEIDDDDGALTKYGKKVGLGVVSSLSYKSEYSFKDAVPLCLPQGGFSTCRDFFLSAPEKVTNWVPGVSFNAKFPAYGPLPDFGLSLSLTYASHTNQVGFQVPVYFTVADSKLSGGFKYFYLENGVRPNGMVAEGDSGVAFFVGTKFNLLNGR